MFLVPGDSNPIKQPLRRTLVQYFILQLFLAFDIFLFRISLKI